MNSNMHGTPRHHAYVSWHLDVKFWLTIIGACLAQAAYLTWMMSATVTKIDSRVTENTANITVLQTWRDKQDEYRAQINSQLAVMDEKLAEQGSLLHRIDERQEKFFSRSFVAPPR